MLLRPSALAFFVVLTTAFAGAEIPDTAPLDAPARGEIAAASEPGPRLMIEGRVLDASTRAPVPGASLYIYQTDRTGLYTDDGRNDNRNPRLHAHLRTGASGEFEAHTIRPAPYPRGGVPAHIHFVVQADGYARRVFEIVFDDDPLVTPQVRDRARQAASMFVVVSVPADGRIAHDILLSR